MIRLVLALVVAVAVAACTRIVVLSPLEDASTDGAHDAHSVPDAHLGPDGGPLPDAMPPD